MTQPVLPVAKGKRAQCRSNVEHKNQHHGFLLNKPDHLFGVDGRQRDGHGHAALVRRRAGQQPHEIAVAPGVAVGRMQAAQ